MTTLRGQEVPEEAKKIIEGHYIKSEHKRNMPVTYLIFTIYRRNK